MNRKEKQTSTDVAIGVFDTCAFATLSLSYLDKPYAVPLSMVRVGNTLYFHCAHIGTKSDIISHNNLACVSAVAYANLTPNNFSLDYLSAIAYGVVTEVTDPHTKRIALMAIATRFALPNIDNAASYIDRALDITAIFQLDIISITGKSSTKNLS